MYRTFSPSRFEHVKTPKSHSRHSSQLVLDNSASLIRSAKKSPTTAKNDPIFISDLQSQLTHALNQRVDGNLQCNRLESINKQLELKNSRLIEEMKQMREAEAQKDKELYNLHVHNNYLATENNELEKQAGEYKNRIFKLERRLLEFAKMLGITNFKDISLTHTQAEESRRDSHKLESEWGSKSVNTESYGGDKDEKYIKELETKISNQTYEIQVLRATLESRGDKGQLSELDKDSLVKETEEIRLRFLELRKETDNLSKENQILAADNEILKEKLKEQIDVEGKQKREEEILLLKDEIKLWQKKVEGLEEEKNSLYEYLEDLKQQLRKSEEENMHLTSSLRELERENQTKEAYNMLELEAKESQIKLLKEQLNQEKERAVNLTHRVTEELNKSEVYKQEEKNYAKIEYINNQLLKEIDVLKGVIEEQDKEIERNQQTNEQLAREHYDLRDIIQTFIERNVGSTEENPVTGKRSLDSSTNRSKQVDTETLVESLHQLELERQGLQQALNDAVNLCASYRAKDKEKDFALQQKDQKINSIHDSKAAIEQMFGAQLVALKDKNEKLLANEQSAFEKIKALKTENEQLRSVIKTYEKKPFELPSSIANRYHRKLNS